MDAALRASCAVEAAAVFGLAASANHACDPNCAAESAFDAPTIEFVAQRAIQRGEEITISYFDVTAVCGASADAKVAAGRRRKLLRRNYLFDCACDLCQHAHDL